MQYLIYRSISWFIPLIGLFLIGFRIRREPDYRFRVRERFGWCPRLEQPGAIWVHAVSAGEVAAAAPIVKLLLQKYPSKPILVTTSTPTGSAAVSRLFGTHVHQCYLPYDTVWCIRRFLRRTQPDVLFLIETEIWPNLIVQSKRQQLGVYVINARMSERSSEGYSRYRSLMKGVLANIDAISTQYEDSADRFLELGFLDSNIHVSGNLKFDTSTPTSTPERGAELTHSWFPNRSAWMAASTHQGEEETVLEAHQKLTKQFPSLGLILAPRHPHRAPELLSLAQKFNLTSALFSGEPTDDVNVLIVDEMGVLFPLYWVAKVVFLGGSLEGTGGHNPIEPAMVGRPLIMGPDRFNFEEVCARFEQDGCLSLVQNSQEMQDVVATLLTDSDLRAKQGESAKRVVNENQGATDRLFTLLTQWIESSSS